MPVVPTKPHRRERPPSSRSWMRGNSLGALAQAVRDAGHDPKPLFSTYGLEIAVSEGPDSVVPITKMAQLLDHIATTLKLPDVGMRLAQQQRRERSSDPVDLAIFNAPTLKEVFSYGARYASYYSTAVLFEVRKRRNDEPICLYYRFSVDQLPSEQITEYGCLRASFHILDLAASRPVEIWFRHRPLAPASVYAENFGAPVRFGMPYDAIFVGADDWSRPIEGHDPKLHQLGQALAAKRKADVAPLSAHLRGEIERLLPARKCSYDSICKWSGLPPRTLRRYLADERTTFAQLKDEVRRDNIRHALTNSDMGLSEMAQFAGYYDPSSVTRNLPRWFGTRRTGKKNANDSRAD